jgi:hypothetical protein
MAIVFDLVINYGRDHVAAENASRQVAAHPPLTAGPHTSGCTTPERRRARRRR